MLHISTMNADSDATSYTIGNLFPCCSDYALSIAVMNEAGIGDFSPPLSVATKPGGCMLQIWVYIYVPIHVNVCT